MSASKKSSGGAGQNRLLPPVVDGVTVPSTDENDVDDAEVHCTDF